MRIKAISTLVACLLLLNSNASFAVNVPVSLFKLAPEYTQLDHWLKPTAPDHQQAVVTKDFQHKRTQEFYQHWFGKAGHSPWSQVYVNELLSQQSPDLSIVEHQTLGNFSNKGVELKQKGYGENFRLHSHQWLHAIAHNIDFKALANTKRFRVSNRAIITRNVAARVLPTGDPHFHHFTSAGKGFPFDNLQMSSVWIGTPVYILGATKDRAWNLVLTPAYIAWVASDAVARVDPIMVEEYRELGKQQLAAIVHTKTPLIDRIHHQAARGVAYVGAVFPWSKSGLLVPFRKADGTAGFGYAKPHKKYYALMPLAATPENFKRVMQTLIGRPYGWGGSFFDNDCSQELRSLFTPFGFWLARHSSAQIDAGKVVDKSALSPGDRIKYLKQHGHKFMTIIYIGGHIILYTGNYPDLKNPKQLNVMTYQNMWGLAPPDRSRRVVVGKSVFFPMKLHYRQDPKLMSHATRKQFKVAFLDQMPIQTVHKLAIIPELRDLM